MQTCSNCGATSRAGAKFCTTCGTRLNESTPETTGWAASTDDASPASESQVAQSSTDSERSAADDVEPADSRDTTTSWGWSDSSATTSAAPDAPVETPSSVAGDEARPSAEPEPASSWSWAESTEATPAPTSGDEPSSATAEPEAAVEAEPASSLEPTSSWTWGEASESTLDTPADDPSASRHVDRSGSVFSWSWSQPSESTAPADPDDGQPENETDQESVEQSVEAAAGEDFPEPSEVAAGAEPVADDTISDVTADQSDSGDDDTLAAWSAGWQDPGAPDPGDDTVSADLAAENNEGQWVDYGLAATDAAPRERAEALLDELRALIPTLAAPVAHTAVDPGATSGPDATSGALDDLAAARASGLGDTSDLRRALVTTRDSPRDVHAMIDLVGRIEDIIAVLDDRDRLIAAIDQATGTS